VSAFETTGRFMRPIDVSTARRSRRRVQIRRLLVIFANVVLAIAIAAGATWLWQRAHRDERFAIRTIDVSGRNHADAAAVRGIVGRYQGANLFQLDIAALQAKLEAIPWVEKAAIEKGLPDTLRIEIVERVPAALVEIDGTPRYIDANGVIFAPFDAKIGGADLPMIEGADRGEAAECVRFLGTLRLEAPDLFARVVSIRPERSSGWVVEDRSLHAPLSLPAEGAVAKWRLLDRIAAAEGLDGTSLEYADLRFRRQIVVKKKTSVAALARGSQQITGEGHVQD